MILPKGIDENQLISNSESILQPFREFSAKQLNILKSGSEKSFSKIVTIKISVGICLIFFILAVLMYVISLQAKFLIYVGLFQGQLFAIALWFIYQSLFLKSNIIRCYYGQEFYNKFNAQKKVKRVRIICAVIIPFLYILAIVSATKNLCLVASLFIGLIGSAFCLIFAIGRFKIGESGGNLSYCKGCGRINTIFFLDESRKYGDYNAVREVDKVKSCNYTVGTINNSNNKEVGRVTGTAKDYTFKYGTQYSYTKTYFCAYCGKIREYKGTGVKWNKYGQSY